MFDINEKDLAYLCFVLQEKTLKRIESFDSLLSDYDEALLDGADEYYLDIQRRGLVAREAAIGEDLVLFYHMFDQLSQEVKDLSQWDLEVMRGHLHWFVTNKPNRKAIV